MSHFSLLSTHRLLPSPSLLSLLRGAVSSRIFLWKCFAYPTPCSLPCTGGSAYVESKTSQKFGVYLHREPVRGLPGTSADYHGHAMFDRANYIGFRQGKNGRSHNNGERFFAYVSWSLLPIGVGIVYLAMRHQQIRANKWYV